MKSLWQIILSILWRLRPVQALEVNLNDVITMGLALFADDLEDLAQDPAYRSTLAAAFFDAHRKLDLLIYLRACEIAGVRPRITSFKPDYSHTHASTDVLALWKSFHRLVAKFDDYERYAIKRAERLRADENDYPLRLAATLQSTSPSLRLVEANHLRPLNVQIASPCAQHWGRWIARPCAQDGGGACAFARGPPSHQSIADCRLPQRSAPEIAPARPNPWLTRIYPRRNVSRETSVGGQNRRVHWSEADMHRHSQPTGRCIKMHPTGSRPAYI
jgi:hypothetical protein